MKLNDPKIREYGYAVTCAALALAVGYGLITPEHVPLWLALIAAVFGVGATGVAAAMVHKQRKEGLFDEPKQMAGNVAENLSENVADPAVVDRILRRE